MSAREMSKGDDPLDPPRAHSRKQGSAPKKPEQDQAADQDRPPPDQDRAARQDQTPEDETKRKFREALAAKQGRKGEDHIDNAQQHVHAQGPVETKRTFRRKTG
jgi:hypothetical protein